MDKKELLAQMISNVDRNSEDYHAVLDYLKNFEIPDTQRGDAVAEGSLVLLNNGKTNKWYFFMAVEGGQFLTTGDHVVLSITPFSPLGREIVNQKIGHNFEMEKGSGYVLYTIVDHA